MNILSAEKKYKLVYLSLGSNKGNRLNFIKKAIREIALLEDFNMFRISPVYETEPWGFKNQNKFLNCAISGFYWESANKLFKEIKLIESKLGRTASIHWHSREIDIDILFYDSDIIETKMLKVPHPEIQSRNFVLVPLNDIAPDFIHPVLKRTVNSMMKNSEDKGKVYFMKDITE